MLCGLVVKVEDLQLKGREFRPQLNRKDNFPCTIHLDHSMKKNKLWKYETKIKVYFCFVMLNFV